MSVLATASQKYRSRRMKRVVVEPGENLPPRADRLVRAEDQAARERIEKKDAE